jgi:hypothetical protein
MRRALAHRVALLALAGCGSTPEPRAIRANEADHIAAQARQILALQLAPSGRRRLPPVPRLAEAVPGARLRRTVGQALQANLTHARLRQLLTELPRLIALYLRGSAAP